MPDQILIIALNRPASVRMRVRRLQSLHEFGLYRGQNSQLRLLTRLAVRLAKKSPGTTRCTSIMMAQPSSGVCGLGCVTSYMGFCISIPAPATALRLPHTSSARFILNCLDLHMLRCSCSCIIMNLSLLLRPFLATAHSDNALRPVGKYIDT
eukprot:1539822-Pleurochrysis_carterae.AAC.1